MLPNGEGDVGVNGCIGIDYFRKGQGTSHRSSWKLTWPSCMRVNLSIMLHKDMHFRYVLHLTEVGSSYVVLGHIKLGLILEGKNVGYVD